MDDIYTYLTNRMAEAFNTSDSVRGILTHAIYEPLDAIVRDAGTDCTCRPGCDACCHRMVVCTRIEALALAEFLHSGMPQALSGATPGIGVHAAALRMAIDGGSKDDEGPLWFNRQVPCPFLAGGRCIAYAMRPLSCRVHHSLDHPDRCREAVRAVRQNRTLLDAEELFSAFIQRIAGTIETGLGVRGLLSIIIDDMITAGLFSPAER